MSTEYKWAKNPLKLQRAIAQAKGGDEQAIKELYISYGGLIAKGYEVTHETKPTITVAETIEIAPVEKKIEISKEEEVEVSKKIGRPVKNAK